MCFFVLPCPVSLSRSPVLLDINTCALFLSHTYPLSFVDLPLSVSHLSLCPSLIPYLPFHAHSCNLPVFLTLLMCLFLVSAPAKFLFKSVGLLKLCGVQRSETTSENPSYLLMMDR